MEANDQKRHRRRLNIVTDERREAGRQNFFLTRMYVPDYLKYYFHETGGVITSSIPFNKKKDSENYVNLLAV